MQIQGRRTVHLTGRGEVKLTDRDHLGTGGEASVYGKDGLAIKLYTPPDKPGVLPRMEQDGMRDKIELLAQKLRHKYIVGPKGLVLYRKKPVGYYMPQATGDYLTYLFAPQWCKQNGWSVDNTMTLVAAMREVMLYAHDRDVVMCDPNELNWFVHRRSDGTPEPRAIDVDAWQVDRWPGTVVAPGIRDWKAVGFTSETDRYALGVLFFQLFTGAHPYKGPLDAAFTPTAEAARLKLPGVDPIPEFILRMVDGVSVFSQGARMSKRAAERYANDVPPLLANWFQDVFLHGKREVPPSPFDKAATAATPVLRVVATKQGETLRYERLLDGTGDPVVRVFPCGLVVRKSGALWDLASKRQVGAVRSLRCEIVQVQGHWLIADWDGQACLFTAINCNSHQQTRLKAPCTAKQYVRSENRLFAANENGLLELEFLAVGKALVLGTKTNWAAMPNTRWFDGVGVTDLFGKMHVNLPFGESAYWNKHVAELDGLKPVAAMAGNRYVVFIAADPKVGGYRKIELTFDDGYRSYEVWQGTVERPELNMAMLDTAMQALSLHEDGAINVYLIQAKEVVRIEDRHIITDMALGNWGDKVVFIAEGHVTRLQTQKKS